MFDFSAVPSGDPITVSATLFVTFERCPQQALGRTQGEYPPESVASFRGSLAHRIFARHLSSGPIDDADMSRACRQEIGAALNPKLGALGISRPSQLAPVLAEVGDLYARFKRFPNEGFRTAEYDLEVSCASAITLRGKVDAVFDDPEFGTRIVDWKTGADLDDATDQLSFYALAWELQEGALPGRAEAVSIRTGERVILEPTARRAVRTGERIATMVSALRAAFADGADLPRTAGPMCRYCPLLDSCREGSAAVAVTAAG